MLTGDGSTAVGPDDRHDPAHWPRWVFAASATLILLLAALLTVSATRPEVVAPLAVVVTLPWLYHLTGRHLPAELFLALGLGPLLVLNTMLHGAAGATAGSVAALTAVYIAGESVGALSRRMAAIGVVVAGVIVVIHAQRGEGLDPVYLLAFCAIAMTAGYLMRKQQQTLLELRETQSLLAGEAALQERQRIAREVHDVVAHSLTVTMMHLTAARMAVLRDPETAVEALEEAERLGRQSLNEIRGTVGLLRDEDERATARPVPTAAEIDELVAGYQAAGVDIDWEVEGELAGLEPNVGLTLYRLVQEAIANAVKHAPGSRVLLDVDAKDSMVTVQVANPFLGPLADPSHGGMGLSGMRERVELVGGWFDAGATDGRWVVSATLPRTPAMRWQCR